MSRRTIRSPTSAWARPSSTRRTTRPPPTPSAKPPRATSTQVINGWRPGPTFISARSSTLRGSASAPSTNTAKPKKPTTTPAARRPKPISISPNRIRKTLERARATHSEALACATKALSIVHSEHSEESAFSQKAKKEQIPRRSEEHTSELQSRLHLVCRLLLEKKK